MSKFVFWVTALCLLPLSASFANEAVLLPYYAVNPSLSGTGVVSIEKGSDPRLASFCQSHPRAKACAPSACLRHPSGATCGDAW